MRILKGPLQRVMKKSFEVSNFKIRFKSFFENQNAALVETKWSGFIWNKKIETKFWWFYKNIFCQIYVYQQH